MDVGDEQDVLLQRTSSSYLTELRASLPRFLYHDDGVGQRTLRSRVRSSTTNQMVSLLEPFQEWPQLLDPSLRDIVQLIGDALLQNVREDQVSMPSFAGQDTLVISLSEAAAKLLYTLCKIRGPKVITRLLSNEAEVLEPILDRFEDKLLLPVSTLDENSASCPCSRLAWEEKYTYMIWLSHLLFAPFDLSTVASSKPPRLSLPQDLLVPDGLPQVVLRLIGVALTHIASPGKDREAAVKLLSRLASRPDMLRLGVHTSLINWCLRLLKEQCLSKQPDQYRVIGMLSLLGTLSNSLSPAALQPLMLAIFRNIMSMDDATEGNVLKSSAVARKAVIKLLRSLTLAALQLPTSSESPADQMLEDVVDHLLTSLADNDTPVRQSSSKALSIIASRLDPEMEAEIVEAVTGSLEENVLWIPVNQGLGHIGHAKEIVPRTRDTSVVNPVRWHGLVLSLSQLLFQRSAPASQLHSIINDLLLALQFEKRAASGTSLGANVRDAANFGVWSIARKYSTKELAGVQTPLLQSVYLCPDSGLSTIQSIATELVVAACLDPSGNIRRGSSAALQELIGRHPDAVTEGISIVQSVDYHAVALRSRAMCDISLAAARLGNVYWERLVDSVCGWRGLRASDSASRRLAATALASLANACEPHQSIKVCRMVLGQLQRLKKREVEARHGLLLALAAMVQLDSKAEEMRLLLSSAWELLLTGHLFDEQDLVANTKRPELTAEAVSEVICSLFVSSAGSRPSIDKPSDEVMSACETYLELSLQRREIPVLHAASRAAAALFEASIPPKKQDLVDRWIKAIAAHHAGGSTVSCHGFISALGKLSTNGQGELGYSFDGRIRSVFLSLLEQGARIQIETRVVVINSLSESLLHKMESLDEELVAVLSMCLEDYTTDQRGDIGSLVRLEAIKAVETAARRGLLEESSSHKSLISLVAILAGEKLDKVRYAAWNCLGQCKPLLKEANQEMKVFEGISQISEAGYFEHLLRLMSIEWLQRPILQGLAVSVGTGSETVLRAARLALCRHCTSSGAPLISITATMLTLLRDNMEHDRILVPLLETWAYLFQSQLISPLSGWQQLPDDNLKKLFVQVQKAHYKSGSVPKLTSAIEIYSGLAPHDKLRDDVLRKLSTMLYHPLAKVRNSAADMLYVNTKQSRMKSIDWSKPPKEVKKAWPA